MRNYTKNLGSLAAAVMLCFGLNVPSAIAQDENSAAMMAEENSVNDSAESAKSVDPSEFFQVSTIQNSASEVTAHEVIANVTDEVLAIVKKTQDENVDPLVASEALDELMTQVVDFRFIILNVMENSARSASREQLQSFARVFKQGLINTYAKGMTSFVGFEVEILPPDGPLNGRRNVTVQQEVTGPAGSALVSYSMAIDKDENWVLRNVVINGINLGKQFRNQFRVAIKKNDNDLDKVIQNWNA